MHRNFTIYERQYKMNVKAASVLSGFYCSIFFKSKNNISAIVKQGKEHQWRLYVNLKDCRLSGKKCFYVLSENITDIVLKDWDWNIHQDFFLRSSSDIIVVSNWSLMYVSEINFNKSEKINKNSEFPNINVNNLGNNGSATKGMVLFGKIITYLTTYSYCPSFNFFFNEIAYKCTILLTYRGVLTSSFHEIICLTRVLPFKIYKEFFNIKSEHPHRINEILFSLLIWPATK